MSIFDSGHFFHYLFLFGEKGIHVETYQMVPERWRNSWKFWNR